MAEAIAGRVLAIDFGTRRLGLATCDELGMTCRPLETWSRLDPARDFDRIRSHVETLGVDRIVVGRPVMLDGRTSEATDRADEFAVALRDEVGVPVDRWDEALTSWEADRRMDDDGVPRARRRMLRDAYAALVLLEDYLRSQASR